MSAVISPDVRARQNSYLDQLVSGSIPFQRSKGRQSAPLSLRPDELVSVECVEANPEFLAIRDAWRFHEPVTVMESAELDALSARYNYTFHGVSSDREAL